MFSGEAESVLVPGSEGDFVVLKDHAPVMASLKPGVIAIEDAAGKHKRVSSAAASPTSARPADRAAETALPEGELDAARLDQEIRDTRKTSPTRPTSRSAYARKARRLRELKEAMKL